MARTFSELTSMRVGGPTRDFAEAASTEQLIELVRGADAARTPLLVMGDGTNLVVGDPGWDGLTVKIASSNIEVEGTTVRADAGLNWDSLVQIALANGLAGVEALSGVPGTVGGTPVQNVGAFGTLTSDVLKAVTVLDRTTGLVEQWGKNRCGFGSHRQSTFKHTDRYVVLRVEYELRRSQESRPVNFAELARTLEIGPGGTAAIAEVREAVLSLRRKRGSILDADDHDTWSAGSFFINPVLREIPMQASACPRYPDPLGTKLPAGWLVQQAGFPPGYGLGFGRGAVALSSKHTLSVSNRSNATTAEVMAFAAHIRAGVEAKFGIRLRPECHLVNCSLDDARN